jgi:uncharacterized caspase-like protein
MGGSRVALVVANDQYADPGLRSLAAPAQDAAALAEVLTDPSVGGFDVRVLHNESAQEIRFAVEDFFADRAPEDLLLLHFSCHGLKNAAGELFLAVADTRPTRLASTAVAADFVNRQMADSRAQRIALFLDCCYGGAFPRGMVVRAAGEAQVRDAFAGQEQVGGGRGRVIVTASSAMEYAFEGGQLTADASTPRPSVFTSAVVDGLTTGEADKDGDGWVGLTELVGYVTDRVHRVTPNQNPQMWTFGSQGELLIARSRIRRITAAPLAPELSQAMESPLPAARFGVVDYLRERLGDADLAQAYAAWQALHRMVDDDSRKVSEAATEAIAEGVPRVTPAELDLELADGVAVGELRVEGPPVARTAVASSAADWVRVEQDGATVRLTAAPTSPSDRLASVVVEGPTGQCTVPVRLTMPDTESEPPPPPPEPEPPSKPTPVPQPPEPEQAEPTTVVSRQSQVRQKTPEGEKPPTTSGQVPWWAVAALTVCALGLVFLNWPSAYRYAWYDHDNTGWYVLRGWGDPVILSSFAALLAGLAARWSGPIALGIVAGCAASLIESGLLILGSGISWNETGTWIATVAVAAAMVAVLLIVLRPAGWRFWPVAVLTAVLIVAGGLLLLASALIKHPDGISWFTVTKLAVLQPLVTVGLAWLAVAATETRTRIWLSSAVTTYAVISIIGTVPAATRGDSPPVFLTALFGNALVAAAVLIRVRRPPSHL